MIIEGILTTESEDGSLHLSPLGPHVDASLKGWELQPFQTSHTFLNLRRTNRAIFHVVDDALLLARAACGEWKETSNVASSGIALPTATKMEQGWLLEDCCHWYSLEITNWDLSQPRSVASARVSSSGACRPFWGWNRAKHAVLEAAILITRLHLLPREEIFEQLQRLQVPVDKTAGDAEATAFELLKSKAYDYFEYPSND